MKYSPSLLAGLVLAPAVHAGMVDVAVVDAATRVRLPTYSHQGTTWVQGTPNAPYALKVTNNAPHRVMAVLSVDGVNIVTGETASPTQTGYVLNAGQTAYISGWRKSMTHAAGFHFTGLEKSYAARTDRPANVGVIGVAVFREKPLTYDTYRAADGVANSEIQRTFEKSASPRAVAQGLGTGHGASHYAPTNYTDFERARDTPDVVLAVRYDSYKNLVKRGIIPVNPGFADPNPFPGKFVPDPPL